MRISGLLVAAVGLLAGGTMNAQQRLPAPLQPQRIIPERVIDAEPSPATLPMRGLDGRELSTRWNGKNRESRDARVMASNDSLFATSYDFQTNGGMPDRIINWPGATGNEGIFSTILYMAAIGADETRGTYGAVYVENGPAKQWAPINLSAFERLEPERTGFNEVDHLNTNEIVNVSHTETGINFMLELAPGTGSFASLALPGGEDGLWARVAVDKTDNTIHVIWSYQNDTEGAGSVAYSRSTDMGETWSPVIKLMGPGSDLETRTSQGGDSYQIAAANGNVVVWLYSRNVEIIQRRSVDGGVTFPIEEAIFVQRPIRRLIYAPGSGNPEDSTRYVEEPMAGSDTLSKSRSDTTDAPASAFDLMVSDDGRVRGVYPIVPTYIFQWQMGGGAPDSSFVYQADFNYTNASLRYIEFDSEDQGFTSLVPPIRGLDNSAQFLDTRSWTSSFARWPQLGKDAEDNLYLAFVSGQADDFVTGKSALEPEVGSYLRGHIYVTWTRDGETWSTPLNLTPTGTDAQYPALADLVDDELHIAYQADYYPGDYLTSSTPPDPPATGGSQLHPAGVSAVRAMILETSSLPEPGVTSVRDRAAIDAGHAIVGTNPNPSNGMTSITYRVGAAGSVSLKIYNTMGQEMLTVVPEEKAVEGTHRVSFDATSLPAGSYMVVLSGNGGRSVQALNVVR